jgi:hypothetical protein
MPDYEHTTFHQMDLGRQVQASTKIGSGVKGGRLPPRLFAFLRRHCRLEGSYFTLRQRHTEPWIGWVKVIEDEWSAACENERSIPPGQICPSDLVILVSTNLLSRPWNYKKELLDGEGSIPQSLTPFDLEYSVMIFDERHLAKSMGQLQNCLSSARQACRFQDRPVGNSTHQFPVGPMFCRQRTKSSSRAWHRQRRYPDYCT